MNSDVSHDFPRKRSFLLWFLAICTLVNAGISILSYLLYMFFPQLVEQSLTLLQQMPAVYSEQYAQSVSLFLAIPKWQYALLILSEAAAFAGALIMLWKLEKTGFHFYVIGKIIGFVTVNFIIGGAFAMDFSSVILMVLIILMYATQLRYFPAQNEGESLDSSEADQEDEQ